jgi:hypothetical protein
MSIVTAASLDRDIDFLIAEFKKQLKNSNDRRQEIGAFIYAL